MEGESLTTDSVRLLRTRLLAVVIAGAAAIALLGAAAAGASVRPGPSGLAFYRPPKNPVGGSREPDLGA
jgi:hypothetical protein